MVLLDVCFFYHSSLFFCAFFSIVDIEFVYTNVFSFRMVREIYLLLLLLLLLVCYEYRLWVLLSRLFLFLC